MWEEREGDHKGRVANFMQYVFKIIHKKTVVHLDWVQSWPVSIDSACVCECVCEY